MGKTNLPDIRKCTIAVIGLGYVGLPLAVEFAKTRYCKKTKKSLERKVIGFDLNANRLKELSNGIDKNQEISKNTLNQLDNISFTNEINLLSNSDVFIVTVPTPIDANKKPNLQYIESASEIVGLALHKRTNMSKEDKNLSNPIVIYESTVYPGTTEEICIPILERESGLAYNNEENMQGFFCGYSPERINPSDKIHTLSSIIKVTSGGNDVSAKWIDSFYSSIITGGTHLAPSIKVAEAAKVIENTQRDLNIALINELSIIFSKLKIDTNDVLDAASTKWNFLKFKPGLVGGHCISVDPYYLTFKSEQLGYYPEVVLAGRRINDSMSKWVVDNLLKEMISKRIFNNTDTKVLILGFTFKENCCDTRNTKVFDIVNELKDYEISFDIVDPRVDQDEVLKLYNLKVFQEISLKKTYGAVLVTVAHDEFKKISISQWKSLISKDGIYFDLQNIIPRVLKPIRL